MTFETGRPTPVDPSSVGSRDDFAAFVEIVLADLRASGAGEWENGTLERFLDGLAAASYARVVDRDGDVQEFAEWKLR